MKQQIYFDQWDSLSEKCKLKLDTYLMKKTLKSWHPNLYAVEQTIYIPLRLMNIGEMIEFLGINLDSMENEGTNWIINQDIGGAVYEWSKKIELCDALWEAVKSILEKND